MNNIPENGKQTNGGHINEAYDSKESVTSSSKYVVNSDGVDGEAAHDPADTPEMRRLAKGFALAVAYGANIGGIATLTGTPPNLVLKDRVDKLYEEYDFDESPISFAKWMGFAFPLSLICVLIGWCWLVIVFLRCGCCKKMDAEHKKGVNQTIKDQFNNLGRITIAEIQVLFVFVLLVFLWLFRAPPNINGWGDASWLKPKTVSDSTPCILLSVLLFILPKEKPQLFCWHKEGRPKYTPILNWTVVAQKLPWGVIVLLGGGFALAKASQESHLSEWVGNELKVFADQDDWVLNLIITLIVAGATEVTSNTATATLLMPILQSLGLSVGIHPLYLMIAATVACSFAFMLPVATPPNAIVFATGYLSIPDMALAGLPMNVIAVLTLTLAINTWGVKMYDLGELPGPSNGRSQCPLLKRPSNGRSQCPLLQGPSNGRSQRQSLKGPSNGRSQCQSLKGPSNGRSQCQSLKGPSNGRSQCQSLKGPSKGRSQCQSLKGPSNGRSQ
ncbi:hypothetical protein ACF0H5_017077 [Mactra antiquata]